MKEFVNNLLPRVINYSQSLDRKEYFIEKPWVWVDKDGRKQKLIFKRNGELLMSFDGNVNLGKWEYLPVAKSLLLDRVIDKVLLNQAFIDETVMVLQYDGRKEDPLLLANELLLPDLNVEQHLREVFYKNHNIKISKLVDGKSLEVHNTVHANQSIDKAVTIDLEDIPDGRYETAKGNVAVVVSGTLKGFYSAQERRLANGQRVIVEASVYFLEEEIPLNTLIYESDGVTPLPDGKYKYSNFSYFNVVNGEIVKRSIF